MKKHILALAASGLLALSGCAITDVGEIDVRYSPVQSAENTGDMLPIFVGAQADADGNPVDEYFEEGDLISIHLVYGYISEFDETWLTPSEIQYMTGRVFSGRSPRIKGEIVIAARVFEFTGQGDGDFSYGNSSDVGRVVFYSDDVLQEQGLNFRNLPVYGPIRYTDKPLAMRLEARELDTNSEEEKALLDNLEKLGQAAYAPLSPALSVLNELGTTVIDSQPSASLFFRMLMVFDPAKGGNVNHLALRPGYLILVKDRDRQGNFDWNSLLFCPEEGKLYYNTDEFDAPVGCDSDQKQLYGAKTYFVVEIAKNVGVGEVQVQQTGYKALIEVLQADSNERLERLAEPTENLAAAILAERIVSDIRSDILKAAGDTDTVSAEDRVLAGIEALTSLAKYASAICGEDAETADISRDQLDYLFGLIRRNSPPDAEGRAALMPFGDAGYCPVAGTETVDASLFTANANRIVTTEEVRALFGIE